MCAMVKCGWKSEDNIQELVLSVQESQFFRLVQQRSLYTH